MYDGIIEIIDLADRSLVQLRTDATLEFIVAPQIVAGRREYDSGWHYAQLYRVVVRR